VDGLLLIRHTFSARHWLWKTSHRRRALPVARYRSYPSTTAAVRRSQKIVGAQRRIF
jgi:hypothetical protein